MSIGRNEYGLFIGKGVSDDVLFAHLDAIVGKNCYAPFPGYLPEYEWGIALQGWPQSDVEEFARALADVIPVPVMPDWVVYEQIEEEARAK